VTVADDFKAHDRLACRGNANAQSVADNGTALKGAVHETHGHGFGCVLEASAVNAKAFLAEAAAPTKFTDGSLDNVQISAPLGVKKRRVGRVGCADGDSDPENKQAGACDAERSKFASWRRERSDKPQQSDG
jgi:hypothetical protein